MGRRPTPPGEPRHRGFAVRTRRDSPHQRARVPSARPRAVEPVCVRRPDRPLGLRARAPHAGLGAARPDAGAVRGRSPPPPRLEGRRLQHAAGWRPRPLPRGVAGGGPALARGSRRPAPAPIRRVGRARPDRRACTSAASPSTTRRDGRAPFSPPSRSAGCSRSPTAQRRG